MRLPLHRCAVLSLALCAMLLRALLPDGWMPSAGAAPFTICSVDGVRGGGKTPAAPTREQSHAPCAFAAAAPLSPPTLAAIALPAPSRVAHAACSLAEAGAPSASLHRPHAPRAPPAFSRCDA